MKDYSAGALFIVSYIGSSIFISQLHWVIWAIALICLVCLVISSYQLGRINSNKD